MSRIPIQRRLSLKQKLEIIEAESKQSNRKKLIKKYKCNSSTISRIMKQKDTYLRAAKYGDLLRTRLEKCLHPKVEDALFDWFNEQKNLNTVSSLNNADLLEKAKELAIKYDRDFEPCLKWLETWKRRNGIKIRKKRISRSSISVREASVGSSSCPMVEICKVDFDSGKEDVICNADSTSKQINQVADTPVDIAPVHHTQLATEEITTSKMLQVNVAPVENAQLATEQVTTNNRLQESAEDSNTPSISEALQALLVVKQFFILNDMEIGSLFSIEEKILQLWKKNI